jgi:hypothetical protein
MLASAHGTLRDRYARRGFILDSSLVALSTWIVALVFVEPRINVKLTPGELDSQMWIGFLSIGAFLLSLLQIKVDWKGRSEAHRRAWSMYCGVTQELRKLLTQSSDVVVRDAPVILMRYDLVNSQAIGIGDRDFLRLKRHHQLKVALSQYLDKYPSASITLTRWKFWIKANLYGKKS